jgi:hypothetical protein
LTTEPVKTFEDGLEEAVDFSDVTSTADNVYVTTITDTFIFTEEISGRCYELNLWDEEEDVWYDNEGRIWADSVICPILEGRPPASDSVEFSEPNVQDADIISDGFILGDTTAGTEMIAAGTFSDGVDFGDVTTTSGNIYAPV